MVRKIAHQGQIELALDEARTSWPPTGRFPYNFGHERVERVVRADLLGSKDVLLITGYTSLDWIIDLLAAFRAQGGVGEIAFAFSLASSPRCSRPGTHPPYRDMSDGR